MNRRHVLSCLLLTAAGCAASSESDPNVGTAVLELRLAPPTVQCLVLTIYGPGGTTITQNLPVTPGVTTSFQLTGLPIGVDAFNLNGYSVSCAAAATASATWLSDSLNAQVVAEPPVVVSFKLRPPGLSGRATVGVEFPQAHGVVTEFPTPGVVTGIATGSDGNFWLAEGGMIARVTPSGVETEFFTPQTGGNPNGLTPLIHSIVAGPDGALWYADTQNRFGIVRMETSGATKSFIPSSGPNGLCVGADGNLWFTMSGNNRIGRITPDGAISEWNIPTAVSNTNAIAAGADGNVWFTETNPSKIGRITPAGVITEFPLTAGAGPDSIVGGPDGNVWFTESYVSRIGRITPAGVVAEFTVPSHDGWVTNIARGTDGQLWFAESATGPIGRVSTTGVFSELLLPSTTCYANGFVAGPDGNMWFSEGTCKKVARVIP